jgi:hypothetical protein
VDAGALDRWVVILTLLEIWLALFAFWALLTVWGWFVDDLETGA